MLMAMAWVRLQAVKRVPSRTFLPGAHVTLMLETVSYHPSGDTISTSGTYRDPTALYRSESAPMTSLFDPGPAFRFGVATLPATLLRLLSAMTVLLLCAFV